MAPADPPNARSGVGEPTTGGASVADSSRFFQSAFADARALSAGFAEWVDLVRHHPAAFVGRPGWKWQYRAMAALRDERENGPITALAELSTRVVAQAKAAQAKAAARPSSTLAAGVYSAGYSVAPAAAPPPPRKPRGPCGRCACYLLGCCGGLGWWLRIWRHSKPFWRVFPWCVSVPMVVLCAGGTFYVAQGLFMDDPSNTMVLAWVETVSYSLGIGWLVQDVLVIIIRNNLKISKTRIRSAKYQGAEKFLLAPLAWLKNFLATGIRLIFEMN